MFITKLKMATITVLVGLACCLAGHSSMRAGQPPAVPPSKDDESTKQPEKEDEKKFVELSAEETARIFPDGLSHDFGIIPSGSLLVHSFRIVNNTAKTMHIASVRGSCPAPRGRALEYTLKPGQETAVVIQWESLHFNGPRTGTLFVLLDAPVLSEVRLTAQANSRRDISFTPQILDFAKIKRGATPTKQMTVTFPSHPKMEVTDVKCESNYIRVKLQELVRGSEATFCQISATVRADIPEGRWQSDVKVFTTNPEMPCVQVPVRLEVER